MFTLNFNIQGNPDRGESDWEESHTLTADTFADMRAKVSKFQGDNDIGGGNWGEAVLTQDGQLVGYMSYNGRVWKGKYWEENREEVIL
jgi:hypothetical protein